MSYEFTDQSVNTAPFFGLNCPWFQMQNNGMTDASGIVQGAVKTKIAALTMPNGNGKLFLRYPGGTVSQGGFNWNGAHGDSANRLSNRSHVFGTVQEVSFGIPEYFDFLASTGARMMYVLNLVGYAPDGVAFDHATHTLDAGLDGDPLTGNDLYTDVLGQVDYLLSNHIYQNGIDQPRTGPFPTLIVGNENSYLDDSWSKETVVRRMNVAAQAIRDAFALAGGPQGNVRVIPQLRVFDQQGVPSPNAVENNTFYGANLDGLYGPVSYHEYVGFSAPETIQHPYVWGLRNQATLDAIESTRGYRPGAYYDESGPSQGSTMNPEESRSLLAAINHWGQLIELIKFPDTDAFITHGLDAGPTKSHLPTGEELPLGLMLGLYSDSMLADALMTTDVDDTNDSGYNIDDGDRHLVANKISDTKYSLLHTNRYGQLKPTNVSSPVLIDRLRVRIETKQYYTETDPLLIDAPVDLYQMTEEVSTL